MVSKMATRMQMRPPSVRLFCAAAPPSARLFCAAAAAARSGPAAARVHGVAPGLRLAAAVGAAATTAAAYAYASPRSTADPTAWAEGGADPTKQSAAASLAEIIVRLEAAWMPAPARCFGAGGGGAGGGGALVSVGEALIDFIPNDQGLFRPVCGGAPFNVCLTMSRLGSRTAFLSNVSSDMFGDKICSELAANAVDLSMVKRVPNPTTLAFVNLEQEAPQYAFFFNDAADRSLTAATLPALPAKTDALHLSMGAVTLATQPVSGAFAALFKAARGKVFTSFDPNIRVSARRRVSPPPPVRSVYLAACMSVCL
eukprot:SAG22_NODE_638_length_8262_cov_4.658826_3_plen_313_part_00